VALARGNGRPSYHVDFVWLFFVQSIFEFRVRPRPSYRRQSCGAPSVLLQIKYLTDRMTYSTNAKQCLQQPLHAAIAQHRRSLHNSGPSSAQKMVVPLSEQPTIIEFVGYSPEVIVLLGLHSRYPNVQHCSSIAALYPLGQDAAAPIPFMH
jgi:hypothetical protein